MSASYLAMIGTIGTVGKITVVDTSSFGYFLLRTYLARSGGARYLSMWNR